MEWTNLPTDYTDATWSGRKKYNQIQNDDGTVSFDDVTVYTDKENSFFGAKEANAMNEAMNLLAENIESTSEDAESAAESASTATTKATAAANSATSASNSATSASNSASTATTKATAAANSATSAANSASSASDSADSASESAEQAQASAEQVAALLYNSAGAHNAIYRGKYLGSAVTDEQYAAIAAGTFDDLYIGDYWTIGGVNWRIAAFDYYYNCGDTNCTTHHAVIVPDTSLYSAQMNTSNVTTGGYVGSAMYTSNLANAKTTINSAFSGHVLSHRVYLTNAITNGYPSAGAWFDSTVELMNENMVYGSAIFRPQNYLGSTIPNSYTVEKSQLPLFQHEPSKIGIRATYWLRDVVSAATFANVLYHGLATYYGASNSLGVRPAFCIS